MLAIARPTAFCTGPPQPYLLVCGPCPHVWMCAPHSSPRYYNNLSYNYRDSDSIAAYYVADAVSAAGSAALQAQG